MSTHTDMEAPWTGWSIVGEPERGAYGGVYEIRPEDGGPHRAMKIVEVPNRLAMHEANEPMPKSREELERNWKDARERALAEYDRMREVRDRHVVESDAVYYDVHKDGDGNFSYRVFIRMELLEPLLKWLNENPADDVTVARIGRDAALGLVACEREHVWHRDIKPANILVKPGRRASDAVFKLGDFGIAREDAGTHDLTQVFTPTYVAPEVCNSHTYDNRSDIYSLGLTLHFILNGKIQALSVESRLRGEPMPRPASGSDDLVRIVLKACAFHPEDRYQHAKDMAADLDAFLDAREGGTTKPMTQWDEGGESQTMPPEPGGMNVYAVLTDGGRTLEFAQTDSGLEAGRKVMFVAHDRRMVSGTILPWLEGMVPSGSSPFSEAAPTVEKVIFHDRVRPASTHGWFEHFVNLKSIEGIELLDTSNVTDMGRMFYHCTSLVSLDLSHFDTSSVTEMGLMFNGCSALRSLDISRFDTSNVTDMSLMLCGCTSLSTISLGPRFAFSTSALPKDCWWQREQDGKTLDPDGLCRLPQGKAAGTWKLLKTGSMPSMAYAVLSGDGLELTFFRSPLCYENGQRGEFLDIKGRRHRGTAFTGLESSFAKIYSSPFDAAKSCRKVAFLDTVRPFSCTKWFSGFSGLKTIEGIHLLDTSRVKSMSCMFMNCSSLVSLNLSHLDTSRVQGMNDMFSGCSSLATLDLSHLDTSSATDMSCMFYGCSSLRTLNLSHLDTSDVRDMDCMFMNCSSLVSLDLSHFDTSNVEDMSGMFHGCASISSLDVSRFDISKVLSLTDMFGRCSSLSSLTIGSYSQLETFKALVPSGCQFRTRDGIVVEPFRFIRSDIYMPDGIDFRGTLEIKSSELGGPKRIPMPDGSTVYFDVPAHLKSGGTHRFDNQGAPNPDRLGSRGSAYVTLNIKKEKQQKRSIAPHPQQKSNTELRSQTKRQSGHKGISRRTVVLCGLAATAGGIALAASRGTDIIGSALSFLGTSPSFPASKATVPYPSAAIVEANVPSHACIDGYTLAYLDGYSTEGYPTSIRLVDLDGTDDRELLHRDEGMHAILAATDDHVFYISYSYSTDGSVLYELHSVDEAYSDDQTIWSCNMGDAIGDSDYYCNVKLFMQQGMLYVAPRWWLEGDSPSYSQWLVMVSPDGSKTQDIIPMTSYALHGSSSIRNFRLYDGSLYTLAPDEAGTAVLCRQGFGDASYTEICQAEGSWDDSILIFFDGKIGLGLHSSSEDAWTCCTMLPDGSDLQQTDWDAFASSLDAAGVRSMDYGWLIGKGDDDRLAYCRLQDSSRIYASIDLYGEGETDLATVTTSS